MKAKLNPKSNLVKKVIAPSSKPEKDKITALLFFMALFICLATTSYAQTFMPAYVPSVGYKKGFVELNNGSKIEGVFTFIGSVNNIKNCTIKDSTGNKHKITGDQIDRVYIKLSKLDKLSTASEAGVSIQMLTKTDFNQIFKADYYVWEHLINSKNNKGKVLQLVNPGFDHNMKVYRDPFVQTTAEVGVGDMVVAGGEEKSYFMVKTGSETGVRVKKKQYKKLFYKLFADCPELIGAYKGKKINWGDLPTHVFLYDQLKK